MPDPTKPDRFDAKAREVNLSGCTCLTDKASGRLIRFCQEHIAISDCLRAWPARADKVVTAAKAMRLELPSDVYHQQGSHEFCAGCPQVTGFDTAIRDFEEEQGD